MEQNIRMPALCKSRSFPWQGRGRVPAWRGRAGSGGGRGRGPGCGRGWSSLCSGAPVSPSAASPSCSRSVELETKVRKVFTITEKTPTRASSWLKEPGEALVGTFSVTVKTPRTFVSISASQGQKMQNRQAGLATDVSPPKTRPRSQKYTGTSEHIPTTSLNTHTQKHKMDQTKTHRIMIVDVQWYTIARHHKVGSMQALVQ